ERKPARVEFAAVKPTRHAVRVLIENRLWKFEPVDVPRLLSPEVDGVIDGTTIFGCVTDDSLRQMSRKDGAGTNAQRRRGLLFINFCRSAFEGRAFISWLYDADR